MSRIGWLAAVPLLVLAGAARAQDLIFEEDFEDGDFCAWSNGDELLWFLDFDEDLFGDPAESQLSCVQPDGYASATGDCDDDDPAIHPGAVELCDGADQDCDGDADDGCSCPLGTSDCDASPGCEVDHQVVAGSCVAAVDLGTFDGDRTCGFACPINGNLAWDLFSTQTAKTSAWFQATVYEDSDCAATIEHRIVLTSPPGADYDLYVYRGTNCSTLFDSSITSGVDEVIVWENEDSGADDSFLYRVEVRWANGASCSSWTLQFYGHNC